MQVTAHAVYLQTLSEHLAKWPKRRARALAPALLDATLLLLRLDLAPLLPMRVNLDSPSPRGRPPWDPLAMFRALLRMTCLRYKSIENFAHDRRQQPRLAVIAGFAPFDTPSVGAFSLCIDRLEDGPSQPSCLHRPKPSALRQGKHWRNLSQEKANKQAARKPILAHCDSIPGQLTQQTLDTAAQPRPDDLQKRLEDSRIQAAVMPAATRGLLGDLGRLIVGGDGSARSAGASAAGKPACPCRSAPHFLVRLSLVSSVEHAKAWRSDDRKALGEDWRDLSALAKIKQMANRHPATDCTPTCEAIALHSLLAPKQGAQ